MKSELVTVNDHGKTYTALKFMCPGCAFGFATGLHILPVNTSNTSPSWNWDGNLEAPTLSPSILTHGVKAPNGDMIAPRCHSYLRAGVFQFLGDCEHELVNQHVPMPDLPDWVVNRPDPEEP